MLQETAKVLTGSDIDSIDRYHLDSKPVSISVLSSLHSIQYIMEINFKK